MAFAALSDGSSSSSMLLAPRSNEVLQFTFLNIEHSVRVVSYSILVWPVLHLESCKKATVEHSLPCCASSVTCFSGLLFNLLYGDKIPYRDLRRLILPTFVLFAPFKDALFTRLIETNDESHLLRILSSKQRGSCSGSRNQHSMKKSTQTGRRSVHHRFCLRSFAGPVCGLVEIEGGMAHISVSGLCLVRFLAPQLFR